MTCNSIGFLSATAARNAARDNKTIYSEICHVQAAILDAIHSCSGPAPYYVLINGDTPITSSYGIEGVTLINGGTNYTIVEPEVTITTVSGTDFEGALTVNELLGTVTAISIVDGGQDYAEGEVLSLTYNGVTPGVGFVANVSSVSNTGEVTGITIVNGGTGFFREPRIVLTDPLNTGSGFVATLLVASEPGPITGVTIVEAGNNYSAGTTAAIVGDGTNGVVIITTDAQKFTFNVDSNLYYQVWAGLVTDLAIKDQLDYIQKYFTDLGYNFRIQVNPLTMNTLQWYISW